MIFVIIILKIFCGCERQDRSRHSRLACLNSKLLLEVIHEESNYVTNLT